jgi:hypothetical protein
MPQVAIKGIFQDGIIIPTEEVPFRENIPLLTRDAGASQWRSHAGAWERSDIGKKGYWI